MLVLSRKIGEKIIIGDNITLTVVDIDRNKVRLGIEASREAPIFRQELIERPRSAEVLPSQRNALRIPAEKPNS